MTFAERKVHTFHWAGTGFDTEPEERFAERPRDGRHLRPSLKVTVEGGCVTEWSLEYPKFYNFRREQYELTGTARDLEEFRAVLNEAHNIIEELGR